ncbi:MAG: hypothetical protein FJZ09_04585 [Candidatus Omnitrophica bacterium]|nr:hypothetical protein [Candidatus Omnitrophota bacterium]
MSAKKRIFILILILLFACGLRFYRLDLRSLWYDEASLVNAAEQEYSLGEILRLSVLEKAGFMLLLKLWANIFPDTEFCLRMLSALLGAGSVFLIYKLGKEVFSDTAGLAAAYLLAISPLHLYFSQEVTQYSLAVFCATLSTLIFFRILKKPAAGLYLSYVAVNLLLMLTQMAGAFIVILHNVYLFLSEREFKEKKNWLITQSLLALCIVPLYLFIFRRGSAINDISWIAPPGFGTLWETLKAFVYGGERLAQGGTGFSIGRQIFSRWLILVCAGIIFKGIFSYRKAPVSGKIIFLLAWAILPVSAVFVFSLLFFPVYVVRYFVIFLPAYILLLTLGIASFRSRQAKAAILALITVFTLPALRAYFYPQEYASWREIALRVKENVGSRDMLFFLPLKQIVPFAYYFYAPERGSFRSIDKHGKRTGKGRQALFEDSGYFFAGVGLDEPAAGILENRIFQEARKDAGRIYLIVSPDWPGAKRAASETLAYFRSQGMGEEKSSFPYPGVELYIYSKQ